MTEENRKKIFIQTYELDKKIIETYNRYTYYKQIIVSKKELFSLHDEIVKERNPISLIHFDIILAHNISHNYDDEYFYKLKQDLDILMELIIDYIRPIIDDAYKSILKYDSIEANLRARKHNLFDSNLLNYDFDEFLGTLLRKHGILDALSIFLPEELKDEELTTKLYKLLNPHELAFTHYANEIYEYPNYDQPFLFEFENSMTNQIFVELANRNSEEIFVFIKDLLKMPCDDCLGVIGGFFHLRKRYSHEFLTSFIRNLKLPGENEYYIKCDFEFETFYGLLKVAEGITTSIGDINSFDSRKDSLKHYVIEYEAKEYEKSKKWSRKNINLKQKTCK